MARILCNLILKVRVKTLWLHSKSCGDEHPGGEKKKGKQFLLETHTLFFLDFETQAYM